MPGNAPRFPQALWPTRAVLLAFAAVSVLVLNVFPHFRNPNEVSRVELVVAMADRGTFAIDAEAPRFGRSEDTSEYGGHLYSNKAPGLAFAALPAYLLIRPWTGRANAANFTTIFVLLRLATVTAATLAALAALARRLRRLAGDRAAMILFAVAFGTPLLIYGRSLFSHAWTASLLYLSFELLVRPSARAGHFLLAGLLAGWAVLSEYQAAVIAAILLVAAARTQRRGGLYFLLGALPAAVLLFSYDAACFGSPLSVSSAHEAASDYRRLSRSPFFGFTWPSPTTAWNYLFSPSRGVLFESPFFLFLPAAAFSPAVRGRASRLSLCAVAVFFLVMCAYENWHGGWAIGSRYLVPALLLAAWPLAGVGREDGGAPSLSTWAFAALSAYSAAFFCVSGATFWCAPHEPPLGIRFYTMRWLAQRWFTPTLLGSSLPASLALPALLTAAAAAAALRPALRDAGRAVLVALAGVLALALLVSGRAPRGSFGDRLTRAFIFSSSSGLDPRGAELQRLAPEAKTPRERALLAAAIRHLPGS